MTKEQLAKGRDLQDAILAAKENVKRLSFHCTDPHTGSRYAVRFAINFYDNSKTGVSCLASDGAEPEIVEKIKQILLDYYTEKVARLEKEFTNL